MIKLLPYYLYQIDAIESWLDDQAKKGLFLTDVRSRLTMGFEKGEPRPVRYRIDVKQNPGTYGEKERVADYKELGWEYVCELAGDLDIYRCDDPTVPELNTDEETLHEVLDKKLKSQTIWSIVRLCAIPVWLYCIFFLYYWKHTGIYAQLISGDAWIFVPAGTLVLFWTITAVTCIVSAVTTRRRILLKRAQRSPAELRRGKILQLTSFALPLAALVLCLILRAVIADPGNPVPVDEFPVPTAAQVFSDTYDHSLAVEFPELLCNHSYLRQKGPNITDPETGSSYSSWFYDADVYQIAWQWVADGYTRERAQLFELQEITVPGWEHAWYSANSAVWGGQTLLLQDGKEVWEIGCDRKESLLDALDKFAR